MTSGYLALGTAGAMIFCVPIVMLWFGVRQYTARTRTDVEELQRANVAVTRSQGRFRPRRQHAPGP